MCWGHSLFPQHAGEPMRINLSALGLSVAVAALALFGALRAIAADGDRTGQSLQTEQNAVQESVAGEPTPACGANPGDRLGMANPAATYCKDLGYQYRTAQTSKGEEGICVFPDGQQCEEWAFLAGKCGKQRSYCAKQGLDEVTKTDGRNPLSRDYAVCVNQKQEVGSAERADGPEREGHQKQHSCSAERACSRTSAAYRHSTSFVRLAEPGRPELDDLRQEPRLLRLLLGVFSRRRRRRGVQRPERQSESRPGSGGGVPRLRLRCGGRRRDLLRRFPHRRAWIRPGLRDP